MVGRFGDLAINRLFTNTFSCVSVRFSPRLELDVASSVRTRCSSVRSLFPQPHAGFPSVCQFWCWISRSFSYLWKMCKNCFSKLHQFSTIRSSHGTIEWRLYLTTSETRNEPRCMSGQSISSVRCLQMVCISCVLA